MRGSFYFEGNKKYRVLLHQIFFLKKQNRFFLPAIGWIVLSTVLLTMPQSAFPGNSIFSDIPWFDKWVHIGMFGIMSLLLCWAFYKFKPEDHALKKQFIWIGVACLLYGFIMELVQKYWVPFRSFDPGDVVADAVGAAGGAWFSFLRYIKK